MKYINSLAIKMALSGMVALALGNILNLNYSTVAAVIAILSIQDTRLKALQIGRKRVIACIVGQVLSIILYLLIGQNLISFGLFLIVFIPMTSKLKVEEGMIPAVVLSTHLLVADSITVAWVINEVALMIIGIGVASIANLFMYSLEDKFKIEKEKIEENYKIIIAKMSKSLITQTVDIDEQKLMDTTEIILRESKETANKIVSNNFYKANLYYSDYINMRMNQFDNIKRMRKCFDKFYMTLEQMALMSKFLEKVSENIKEKNDCEELINNLEKLRTTFKNMELPKTREEFENRAQLLQLLHDIEEFLTIKRTFIINLK